jgi:hypothetical protein
VKRELVLPGVVGLVVGAAIYLFSSAVAARLPLLLQGSIVVAIVFVIFLAIALAEMPMMVWGLRQMARAPSPPRVMLVVTFAIYVAFASVYAAIFVLLTQSALSIALAALCLARFVSGIWIK